MKDIIHQPASHAGFVGTFLGEDLRELREKDFCDTPS